MNTIYFISETTLKNNSPINLNVEQQLLNLAILDAQDTRIQMALGSNLYNKIKDLIDTGDISISTYSDYKTLLDDYIVPALISWSTYECLTYVRYKIMNKSVTSQASDNTTPVDLEELKFISAYIMNKAEFKQQRLIDYLVENRTLFAEYTAANDYDDIVPKSNAYFSGLVLDDETDCERFLGLNSRIKKL